jgi:hypothetical protein
VNTGFSFDGLFDGIDLGNPTNLQLQNFTIEAWIRRASPTRATQDGAQVNGCILHYGFGGYGFTMLDDGTLDITQVGVGGVFSSTLKVTDTNYHHVALTKSNATIYFYVDGVGEISGAYDPGFIFTSPVAIGGRGGDYASSFWGDIDDLAIFNRALTPFEVADIYAAGAAGKCGMITPPDVCPLAGGTLSIPGGPTNNFLGTTNWACL